MKPVLDIIENVAPQLDVNDFDFEDLKKKGVELPEMTVDGLKKFVEAGFGTLAKMKVPGAKTAGEKRKQNNKKKTEPNNKKTKVYMPD